MQILNSDAISHYLSKPRADEHLKANNCIAVIERNHVNSTILSNKILMQMKLAMYHLKPTADT